MTVPAADVCRDWLSTCRQVQQVTDRFVTKLLVFWGINYAWLEVISNGNIESELSFHTHTHTHTSTHARARARTHTHTHRVLHYSYTLSLSLSIIVYHKIIISLVSTDANSDYLDFELTHRLVIILVTDMSRQKIICLRQAYFCRNKIDTCGSSRQ